MRLALALSRSLPPHAAALPAAPSSAPSLSAELAAFESELAEAEAELRGREEEELRRLEGLRRRMDRDEAEDAEQRLAQLSGEVERLRRRRRREARPPPAQDAAEPMSATPRHASRAKRPRSSGPTDAQQPGVSSVSLLYEQLDEAFGWREAQT